MEIQAYSGGSHNGVTGLRSVAVEQGRALFRESPQPFGAVAGGVQEDAQISFQTQALAEGEVAGGGHCFFGVAGGDGRDGGDLGDEVGGYGFQIPGGGDAVDEANVQGFRGGEDAPG